MSSCTFHTWPLCQVASILRVLDHHLAVTIDLLSLESRLCQPSLAPPEAAFAGQRPSPTSGISQRVSLFHEVVGVRAQNVFDVLRVDEDVGRQIAEP